MLKKEANKITGGLSAPGKMPERQFLPLPGSKIPKNLIIRLSNAKNDTKPGNAWTHWSTVVTKPRAGHICPAPDQGNQCGSCRACWSKKVKEVQYRIH